MKIISIIADLIACTISFTINVWILSSFLPAKRKIHWFDYLLFGTVFVLDMHYEVFSNTIASFLGMVICILFSVIYYKGTFVKKCLTITIINIFEIILSIISMEIFSLTSKVSINTLIYSDGITYLFGLILMKMLCILSAYIATRFLNKRNYLSKEDVLIVTVFYICFFSIVFFTFITYQCVTMTQSLQLMFLAVNAFMFILNILILFLVKRLSIQKKFQMENMMLKTQLQEQAHAIKSVEENYLQIRSLRHDMKGYLTSYLLLLEEGKVDSVKKDIRQMLQQRLHSDMHFYTSNQLLNAVLNEQYRVCEENHIACQIRVNLKEDADLIEFSVIVWNLFRNAIDAEQRIPEDCRKISLRLSQTVSTLNLLIQNYIQTSVLQNNPNLTTSKENVCEHGFGLCSVQKLVECRNGMIEIREENHRFEVQIMYPLVSKAVYKERKT